ncbi:hypothetical protein GYMLUDRAFT_182201, partial [Collybiopsis luxurians FD-317 M1]
AGSRIFVQSGIYDEFLAKFTEKSRALKVGNPFATDSYQGPQMSQIQYDRIMDYIKSGKEQGATGHPGGEHHGTEGFFIQPTIFTDTTPYMRMVQEEIFGPCAVASSDIHDNFLHVIRQANDTMYCLASAVFSKDINRALTIAHRLQAGTAWIRFKASLFLHANIPFGRFKQSGIGRELGEYALKKYGFSSPFAAA